VINERDRERHERRRPRAWTRRTLVGAGAVVAGWLLMGGSPAEAAPAAAIESAGTALANVDAIRTAAETAQPAGAGIVEQATAPATKPVLGQGPQRSHTLDSDSGSPALGGVGERDAHGGSQSLAGAIPAVETPGLLAGTPARKSAGASAGRSTDASAGTPVDTPAGALSGPSAGESSGSLAVGAPGTLGAGNLAAAFERSGTPQAGASPDVTPLLGAVAGTAQRVLPPLDEVFPAIPGEPGVASPDNRETPGPSVDAPRTSTEPTSGLPVGFGTESLAAAAAGLFGLPLLVGDITTGGSGAGTGNGPALPDPVPPVPGPFHDVPDGIASSASGHGSVDRGQNVGTDTSPLAVAPQLLTSLPATGRTTGHPERAVRPSVSPD
jgi:hypothetical protein